MKSEVMGTSSEVMLTMLMPTKGTTDNQGIIGLKKGTLIERTEVIIRIRGIVIRKIIMRIGRAQIIDTTATSTDTRTHDMTMPSTIIIRGVKIKGQKTIPISFLATMLPGTRIITATKRESKASTQPSREITLRPDHPPTQISPTTMRRSLNTT